MADDTSLDTPEGRRTARAEIDEAIRAWAAPLDHNSAAQLLQSRGVPAAPVMANWEIISDNHLNDRGFFISVRHERTGTFPYPGFPWRFERTPATLRYPAPMFAEHNREVFSDLLALSPTEVQELYDLGIAADEPEYAAGPSL